MLLTAGGAMGKKSVGLTLTPIVCVSSSAARLHRLMLYTAVYVGMGATTMRKLLSPVESCLRYWLVQTDHVRLILFLLIQRRITKASTLYSR
mmetsp:Transcript_15052/g.30347  ORF Transcript_15052/g.30347 Transcript_15052/m.30347 type:complete len:92 (+) Transcript_15052:1003-1278(+)